jgi:antimicrobial peptide system SdpB family protein
MFSILTKLGQSVWSWLESNSPWTNVYGLARTLLALGTALTLIFNETGILFRPGSGMPNYPVCQGVGILGIFCNFNPYLEAARWVSVVILLIVASGWRPRYTALFHWWISFSLQTSAITVDGGDQVTAVLTFLLLPIALTDKRKWHWQSISAEENQENIDSFKNIIRRLIALTASVAIRIQVAIIYFHAATAKLAVEEWIDGTILYYWFTDSMTGLPEWLKFINPLFTSPLVALITWSSLLVEILLFMALVMPKKKWRYLLILGIAFHLSIAITMGLISFGIAMIAALILYLRPFEDEFSFAFAQTFLKRFKAKSSEQKTLAESA